MKAFFISLGLFFSYSFVYAQQKISTSEMDRINWMEFADFVPGNINTVLLPTGTLEPHGVRLRPMNISKK
jgi:creatinine amidohydrolase